MKYIIVPLCLLFFVGQGSCQNAKGFLISGHIRGLKDGEKLFLLRQKGAEVDTAMRTTARGGKFSFSGHVPVEGEFYVIARDTSISRKQKTIFMVNAKISVSGEIGGWPEGINVSGSTPTDDYYSLLELIKAPRGRLESLDHHWLELRLKPYGPDSAIMKDSIARAKEASDSALIAYNKIMLDFIKEHPNSLYTPQLVLKLYGVGGQVMSLNDLISAFGDMTPLAKNSFYGIALENKIVDLSLTQTLKLGSSIPDFKLRDTTGKILSSRDLIRGGKLTLLDFWASWCHPCRAETPNLRKVYAAFHSRGFNIISITSDEKELAWKHAIEADSMSWVNGAPIDGSLSPSRIFDIHAIPAFVLLDKDGKILAMNLVQSSVESAGGNLMGDDLYRKIQSLLN